MRTPNYSLDRLGEYFEIHCIGTLEQLGRTLGAPARATLFRMLAKIEAVSSYSHRGKFYTLRRIARFNAKGLWEYKQVRFSRFGNLIETLQALVERSAGGYNAKELEELVGVKTKHALTELIRRGGLQRLTQQGVYVYFSAQSSRACEQQRARRKRPADLPSVLLGAQSRLALQEAKAALLLFWATLDERQRRLYAGLESAKLGHGGDEHIAEIFGIDRHTVSRGRKELLEGGEANESMRRSGSGRPSAEKKRPKF